MPHRLSATGNLSDALTFAAFSFFSTLLASTSAYKMLTWREEKMLATASWFAAGVFMGTGMIDLLSESDVIFHWLRFKYPLAFLLSCVGYGVAMLVDCLLARVVRKSNPKTLDEMTSFFASDLQPTKSSDATLPIANSKSHTKDDDGTDYLRYLVLCRARLLLDCIFLIITLGTFSMRGGSEIVSADTKTMALRALFNSTLHNIIYAVSSLIMVLKSIPIVPFIEWLFIAWFSSMGPIGVIVELMCDKSGSMLYTPLVDETFDISFGGVFTGFGSGIFVYLAIHHVLADGNELVSAKSARFSKFVAMVSGIAAVAFLKVIDI